MILSKSVQEFMQHAGALTDSNTLQSLLDQSLLHTEAEWKIATAFLYWRLERFDEQHRILKSNECELQDCSQYWALLGLCLSQLKAPLTDIVTAFDRAIIIDPSRNDLYFNKANALASF